MIKELLESEVIETPWPILIEKSLVSGTKAEIFELFDNPQHPYTERLMERLMMKVSRILKIITTKPYFAFYR